MTEITAPAVAEVVASPVPTEVVEATSSAPRRIDRATATAEYDALSLDDTDDAPAGAEGDKPAPKVEEKDWFEEDADRPVGDDDDESKELDGLEDIPNHLFPRARYNKVAEQRKALREENARLAQEVEKLKTNPAAPPRVELDPEDKDFDVRFVESNDEARNIANYINLLQTDPTKVGIDVNAPGSAADRDTKLAVAVADLRTRLLVAKSEAVRATKERQEQGQAEIRQHFGAYLDRITKSTIPKATKYMEALNSQLTKDPTALHPDFVQAFTGSADADVHTAALVSSKANWDWFTRESKAAIKDPSRLTGMAIKLGELSAEFKRASKAAPAATTSASAATSAPVARKPPPPETRGFQYSEDQARNMDSVKYARLLKAGKVPDIYGLAS
jgi:hypothetical protein